MINVSFAEKQWNPADWIPVKNHHADTVHGWTQFADGIHNEIRSDATPEELYTKYHSDIYSCMLHRRKITGNAQISAEMSFDDKYAPGIAIVAQLSETPTGETMMINFHEVISYIDGINIWHHIVDGTGRPSANAAHLRTPLRPGERYRLDVGMHESKNMMALTVKINGINFGMQNLLLPKSYYVGIVGCEGVNRFYRFEVKSQDMTSAAVS